MEEEFLCPLPCATVDRIGVCHSLPIFIYVGYFMHPASLIFQKSFWNMAETELNVTQDLEKPFTIVIFPYTDSWCLVPFSSNVSWDRKHKGIDCFRCGNQQYSLHSRKGGGRSGIHSK